MNIIVKGKNVEVTNALRDYVEKKMGKLEKYFETEMREIQVTLSVEKERRIVEVTAFINGITLRGEEETEDMYSSVDLVMEKIERQIRKYKTKINRKLRKLGNNEPQTARVVNGNAMTQDQDDEFKIVRNKRFSFKPMNVDEAILQMNLLGHNFFVFTNDRTEQMNVVYERKDGNYGLIEPQM